MNYIWLMPRLAEFAQMRSRLPHALLVHGPEGSGQLELALALAQVLLCEQPANGNSGCGHCPACNWFVQGNHPDFRLIQPDNLAGNSGDEGATETRKKSSQIRIDQIRDLQRFLAVGAHRAGFRVVVLFPADAMNVPTQNALLKGLEEPPPETLFVLVTAAPHKLLPTVRSRCQSMSVPLPSRDQALKWLEDQGIENAVALLAAAGGAPLLAAQLGESEPARRRLIEQIRNPRFDPVAASEQCLSVEPAVVVGWLQRWVYDLFSVRLAGVLRYHRAEEQDLRALASRCNPARLASLLRTLANACGLAQHPLNARLFVEDLLIQYRDLVAGADR